MSSLKGLVFCMTGTLSQTRAKVTALIEKNKGEVKASVTNTVNVLLATENEVASKTQKVVDALAKDIPIVSEDFITECIAKKKQVDMGPYMLSKQKSSKRATPATKSKAPAKKKAKVEKPKKAKKANVAKWSWLDDSGWVVYDAEVAKKIEKAYMAWIKSDKKVTSHCGVDKQRFVDFTKMFQRRFDDPSKRREVKREYDDDESDSSDSDSDSASDPSSASGDEDDEDVTEAVSKLVKNMKKTKLRRCLVPVVEDGEADVRSSKIGGLPYFKSDDEWPTCPNCSDTPMNFFFQIDMATIPKEFQKLYGISEGLLQFFVCSGQDTCGWEPFDNGTLTRVVKVKGPGKSITIPDTEGKLPPKRIKNFHVQEDLPGAEDAGDAISDDTPDEVQDAFHEQYPVSGDKMGGWPNWIQGSSFPDCDDCGTTMTFVFQIESEQAFDYMWGDSGNLQIFQCPKHKDKFTTTASCC